MRPWRSHGNEVDFIVSSADLAMLQCGRGGATEMRPRWDRRDYRARASMRPWRSHGNEDEPETIAEAIEELQCGRGGATEMSCPMRQG